MNQGPVWIALLAGSAACGTTPPASGRSTTTVEDSAGVSIVVSTAPRSLASRYQVDSVPTLDLGGTGDVAEEFGGTVIARELGDGRIVVANQSTSEVRFYDREGKRLLTVGRKGSGPGEFEQIGSLSVSDGDTMLVFDRSTRRLSVVSPAGALVRSALVGLGGVVHATAVFGTLPGGRIVVGPARIGRPPSASGLVRDTVVLEVTGGGPAAEIGRFPGREVLLDIATSGGKVVSINVAPMPFGRTGLFSVVDTLVVVAPSDQSEFDLYAPSGRLVRRVRWARPPEPVTAADQAAVFALENLPNEEARARYRQFLAVAPMAATKPAYDRILPGANGELWVREFLAPYQRTRPGRWNVFGRDGAWLATVALPVGFDPTWIGADRMLGTRLDDDDLVHVLSLGVRNVAAKP